MPTSFWTLLQGWDRTVVAWLLTYLVHSSLLITVVWLLLRGNLIRSNLVREGLWKAALVGGIATSALQCLAGVHPAAGHLDLAGIDSWFQSDHAPTRQEGRRAVMLFRTLNSTEEPRSTDADRRDGDSEIWKIATSPVAASPGQPRLRFLLPDSARHELSLRLLQPLEEAAATLHVQYVPDGYWASIVLVCWIGGSALLLARLALARRKLFRRLAGRNLVVGGRMTEILAALRMAGTVKRSVRLSRSDAIRSPIALSGNEICVPLRAFRDLSEDQQESMLAHELAHLVRDDSRWLILAGCIQALFFFQPLNRVARNGLQEEAEYLCDDWAVRHTGRRLGLARCLAAVAGWLKESERLTLVPGMATRPSALVTRVRRLCDDQLPRPAGRSWCRNAIAAGLLVAVTAVAPTIVSASSQLGGKRNQNFQFRILRTADGHLTTTVKPSSRHHYRL